MKVFDLQHIDLDLETLIEMNKFSMIIGRDLL